MLLGREHVSMEVTTNPFDIPPEEISDRSARYRTELEKKDHACTPAELDWLRCHKEMLQRIGHS